MADTVDVPQVGPVKRQWLYVGGALVVGIVGYAWWRRSQAAGLVVDPATGSLGGGPYANPNPDASGSDLVDTPGGPPTTNEEWTQRVVEDLGAIGTDPGFVAATLGKYLGRQQLTTDEATLVRTAWAYRGRPPVNPPEIIPATSGSTPGTPSGDTPMYTDVIAGWHVDQWIMDVRAGKAGFPAPDFSYTTLLMYNPSVIGNIKWNSATTRNTKDNTFKAPARYRVK